MKPYSDFIKHLVNVINKPEMYFSKESLDSLEGFINGYLYSCPETDFKNYSKFNSDFSEFLSGRNNIHWFKTILELSIIENTNEFLTFRKYLNEFSKRYYGEIMNIRFAISDVCSAFNSKTIGTKVINQDVFFSELGKAVESFDWDSCRVSGQAKINLDNIKHTVLCGVGFAVDDPSYYVLRSHRGRVSSFLKRDYAEATKSLHVILYTKDAYLNDPQITEDEYESIVSSACTHVIVSVLATATDNPFLGTHRFVANLAGGNKEALVWSADEIRSFAKDVIGNENKYVTVAD